MLAANAAHIGSVWHAEMATTTEWAHLPNAPHIDRILAHSRAHPERWDAARGAAWNAAWNAAHPERWDAAWNAAWNAARDAAWNAAWSAARGAAWNAARDAAWDAARDAAWDAIIALIAYDDCAYILDLSPGAVNIMRSVGSAQAVLLYATVLALQEDQSE